MKKYLLFSFVLLVIGLFLCVDLRTLRLVKIDAGMQCHSIIKLTNEDFCDKMPDNERDRKIVEAHFNAWEAYKILDGLIDDDYAWLSFCAWSFLRYGNELNADMEKKLYETLAKLRKLEPENACPDYIEAAIQYRKAVKEDFVNNDWQNKIIDRAALDKAIKFYLQAVSKPYVRIYTGELLERTISLFAFQNDVLGICQRICVSGRILLLPHLNQIREIARMAAFYAEILDKEGKKDESRKILASGRDFILQWAKDNSYILLDYLVYCSANGIFHTGAKKLNDKPMIELYGSVVSEFTQWKNKEDLSGIAAKKYGGYLSNFCLPVLRMEIAPEKFTPERKLTYLIFDRLALIGFALLGVLQICLFAIVSAIGKICRKNMELIKFSRFAWMRIIGLGMILPIVIFLLFSRIDMIGGRDVSLYINKIGFFSGIALLVLMWLWLAVTLRIEIKKTGKTNFFTRALNMIFPYSTFIVLTGIILGTYFEIEENYYCKRETLYCNSPSITNIEYLVVRERTEKLINCLK